MKRIPILSAITILFMSFPSFSGMYNPEKSHPTIVSYSAYVFLAQTNSDEISYPLLPGEIAVTTIENIIETTQEYMDKLRSLYSYHQLSLLTATGGVFSAGLTEKDGGLVNSVLYGEKRLIFSIGTFARQEPVGELLSLRVEAGLDTLSGTQEKAVPKSPLLKIQSSAKPGHPIVIGREIPPDDGHKRALFVVFTPFFSVLDSGEKYEKIISDYKNILRLLPQEQDLGGATLLEKMNLYAENELKYKKIRSVKSILPGVSILAYDEPPEPMGGFQLIQRRLVYPEPAKKAGVQGKALIYVQIDEEGIVTNTRVVQSLPGCDDAAVTAISGIKWKPAMQKEKPVKVWVMVPVEFRLK